MSATGTEIVKATESKAVAKRPIDTFRDLLDRMKGQLELALPRHIDLNRMIRIILTTVQRNPKLLECTRDSLLGCIVQCAQLGLEPDGLLGHVYLIPFNVSRKINGQWKKSLECTLIIGYKGLLKLARQSGEISSISARTVYKKDKFEWEYGLVEKLVHVPSDEEDPGPMTHAYAIFRLKDGSHHFDVMTANEVNRIRDNSQGYKFDKDSSPWTLYYGEMAKKTALRRAAKMSPASIEDKTARAVALDERADAGIPQDLDLGGMELPPEEVPGSEPENQGRRISLKHRAANDGQGKPSLPVGAQSEPPHDEATGETTAYATPEMIKEIDELIFATKTTAEQVLAWYPGVAALADLTAAQAVDAIEKLHILDDQGPAAAATDAGGATKTAGGARFSGGK